MAHNIKFRQSGYETLNTTALVHESYIKLLAKGNYRFESRSHFFSLAAKAMRHILVDYSKKQLSQKRKGIDIPIEDVDVDMSDEMAEDIEALDKALKKLERQNQTIAKVVECRFFSGMNIRETAEALTISESTVKRNWALGKLWLYREIRKLQMPSTKTS